ncbi:hypothetical protein NBM05_06760 [Rothia sp. AR01]|uniref:Uncharacterized protein n=1 Tax=Rothia santali TaxID=2949643 RepID=A0A9X2HAG6_9MICC|nr:hypothetical protein [Rothia santali]MCP3425721.1 hypothetical protein [Rothia santali]
MLTVLLVATAALLAGNLVVVLLVVGRRRDAGWVLAVLLTGTTGAALTAVLLALDAVPARFLDVALVLTGLALVGTAAYAAARRSPRGSTAGPAEPGSPAEPGGPAGSPEPAGSPGSAAASEPSPSPGTQGDPR